MKMVLVVKDRLLVIIILELWLIKGIYKYLIRRLDRVIRCKICCLIEKDKAVMKF